MNHKTAWIVGSSIALITSLVIVDCSCGNNVNFSAYVVDKYYNPPWTETYTSTDSEGRMQIHTTRHPEEWHVVCQDSESAKAFDLEIRAVNYHMVTNGQDVIVTVRKGRWTGINYIPSIVLDKNL